MENGHETLIADPQVEKSRLPSPVVAVLVVVIAFLVASVLAELLVSIYPALKHWSTVEAQSWLTNNTIAQFGYTVVAYGLMVTPIILLLRSRRVRLSVVGLKRPQWRDIGYALMALPLYLLTYLFLLNTVTKLVPSLNIDQKQQIGFEGAHSGTDMALIFISLVVIPPIAEEFMMRGFLFTSLRARLKLVTAVIVTSLVFAAGHLQIGSGAPLLWVASIDTFVLSLFLIFLRVKTDSLWASILLHALKNSLAFVTIFVLHRG